MAERTLARLAYRGGDYRLVDGWPSRVAGFAIIEDPDVEAFEVIHEPTGRVVRRDLESFEQAQRAAEEAWSDPVVQARLRELEGRDGR